MLPRLLVTSLLGLLLVACSNDASPNSTATPTTPPQTTVTATAIPASPTPAPATATQTAVPTPAPRVEPIGLPLDPATLVGIVRGQTPIRVLEWQGGPSAVEFSRTAQPSSDPVAANASGWNCRVHQEYEGQPAVDWYIPVGTEITTTMDGTARLYVITSSNPFDVYGVSREPYIGNPDRARAPLSPFPGPGGGKGIFVRVENAAFVTEYAHLDPTTISLVPAGAFLGSYSAISDLTALFRPLRDYQTFTEIAAWPVRSGDVVGLSGDTGYSEAPHLHYTIRRSGGPLLCPTTEAGFQDGGWLFR